MRKVTVALFAGTLLLAGTGTAFTARGDQPPGAADGPSPPLFAAPGQQFPCTQVAPSQESTTQDGATHYVYNTPGGVATITVPSKQVDPMTASDAQLRANGYPPRPTQADTQRYAQWQEMVKNYNVATGDMCVQPSTGGASGGSGNANGYYWAGEMSSSQSLRPYTDVYGEWYQTGFKETCGDQVEASDTWVGLGGWGSTAQNLAQVGVITPVQAGGGYPLYPAWETDPGTNTWRTWSFTVNPGDEVSAEASYYGGDVYFYIYDYTRSVGDNAVVQYAPGTNTAEFIDEAPKFYIGNTEYQAALRHWYNDNVLWVYTTANGTYLGASWHWNLLMHLVSAENAGPDSGMTNNYEFYDDWNRCWS